MWNKSKSITLTHIIVRACYILLAAAAIGVPLLLKIESSDLTMVLANGISYYVICALFAVVPAGYLALICLDKLLINVKKEMVFNETNVKFLRIISWACFYAGFIGLACFAIILIKLAFYIQFLLALAIIVLAVAEMFMGLVVRVVKNTFEAAIEIKEENELTI